MSDHDPFNLTTTNIIHIAAALIDDGQGKILLVCKSGTTAFMQPGGKIEKGEMPLTALRRELIEEIGIDIHGSSPVYLGRFIANAANEPDHVVQAELFHLHITHKIRMAAEIEEAVWIDIADANSLILAPLTKDYVLGIAARFAVSITPPCQAPVMISFESIWIQQ